MASSPRRMSSGCSLLRVSMVLLLSVAPLACGRKAAALVGDWGGPLRIDEQTLRLVMHVTTDSSGNLNVSLDSIDQAAFGLPGSDAVLDGNDFSFTVPSVNGAFKGTVAADGRTIAGTWLQSGSLPLEFARQAPSQYGPPVDCAPQRRDIPPYAVLARSFQYDQSSPTGLMEMGTFNDNGLKIESIEFANPKGGTCSANLIVPPGNGPFPAIIWKGSGDGKDWEPYAVATSRAGAISVVLDNCATGSPLHGLAVYNSMVRDVINIRRAVDVLIARKDVDRTRIAYVGHSYGSLIGADAVAVDARFKAAVFEVGLQGYTYHICTSPHPFAVGMRRALDGQLPEFVAALAPLDAINYIGHEAPTALLFQSARQDQGVPQSDATAFFEAASQPKQLKWYDTGHMMEIPEVTADRTDFLKKQLGMP
ncbi:MAG: alpha/beta hydrolase family protein [Candidatus Binataceae bacterium]